MLLEITEYDAVEDREVVLQVDADDYSAIESDADAAFRVAESIEEQVPELLEIVAKYMAYADNLGHKEARAWLADYYEESDQRYHAYD